MSGLVHSSALFRCADPDGELHRAWAALGLEAEVELTHRFAPHGRSWVRVGRGVRAVLHTWPEYGLVTVDVYGGERVELGEVLAGLGWERVEETASNEP